jgi:hypothetical protein
MKMNKMPIVIKKSFLNNVIEREYDEEMKKYFFGDYLNFENDTNITLNAINFNIRFKLDNAEIEKMDGDLVKLLTIDNKTILTIQNNLIFYENVKLNYKIYESIPIFDIVKLGTEIYIFENKKMIMSYTCNSFDKELVCGTLWFKGNMNIKDLGIWYFNDSQFGFNEMNYEYDNELLLDHIINDDFSNYQLPFVVENEKIEFYEKPNKINNQYLDMRNVDEMIFKNEEMLIDNIKGDGIYSYFDEIKNKSMTTYYEKTQNNIKKMVKIFYEKNNLIDNFNPIIEPFEKISNFDIKESYDEVRLILKNKEVDNYKSIFTIDELDITIVDDEFLIKITDDIFGIKNEYQYDELYISNSFLLLRKLGIDEPKILPNIWIKKSEQFEMIDYEIVVEFYQTRSL